jgi:hypothetical protein
LGIRWLLSQLKVVIHSAAWHNVDIGVISSDDLVLLGLLRNQIVVTRSPGHIQSQLASGVGLSYFHSPVFVVAVLDGERNSRDGFTGVNVNGAKNELPGFLRAGRADQRQRYQDGHPMSHRLFLVAE